MENPRNYMEELVHQYMGEVLAKDTPDNIEVRKSPRRVSEALCIVLNNVKPFYVTGKIGEVYGYSSSALPQNKTDIMIEIAKALAVVAQKMYTET